METLENHFIYDFFSLFGEIVKKRLKSPNQWRCSWAVIKTPKNKTPLLSAGF
jgi:hypothetical protein